MCVCVFVCVCVVCIYIYNSSQFLDQAISRLPVPAKYRVRSHVTHCKICGGRAGTVTGFSPSTPILPCQYHSTNAQNSSPSTCCSYQDKWAKPGNLPKAVFFWKWGASNRKVLTVFCSVFEGVIYSKVYTDSCPFSHAAGFSVCPPNIRLEPGSCKRTS